jgi:hypothetical protein
MKNDKKTKKAARKRSRSRSGSFEKDIVNPEKDDKKRRSKFDVGLSQTI